MDVAGAAQREIERPRSDGRIALPIDQDERPELAVVGVRLERDRLVQVDVAVRHFVELEMLGRQVLLRVDVDLVLDFGDRRADRARADLQPVRSPGQQRVFAEPQQVHRELVRDLRRAAGSGDDVAATDVQFVGERQHDRLAGGRDLEIAIGGDDARDARTTPRRQRDDVLSGPDRTRGDRAGETAEVLVRATHPLHRHAEAELRGFARHVHGFEMFEQRRTRVPRHRRRALQHVVAPQRRQRDAGDVLDAELRGEGAVAVDDALEGRLRRSRRGPSC